MTRVRRHVPGLRGLSGQRGAMAVEFALVVVPFLLIVLGLVQVGLTFGVMAALNEAATETARALELSDADDALTDEYAQIEARARFKGLDPGRVVAFLYDNESGQSLRLELEYDMPLLVPIRDWNVSTLRAAALVDP